MAVTATNRSRPQRRAPRPAFTLIELLVVISIVALLMAVLLPTLGRVRKQARAVRCQADLRQWGIYYGAAVSEGDREAFNRGTFWAPDDHTGPAWVWGPEQLYGPRARDLLLCPMAARPNPKEVKPAPPRGNSYGIGSTFFAWWTASSEGALFAASYGMNYIGLSDAFPDHTKYDAAEHARVSHRIPLSESGWPRVGRASMPVMFDCAVGQFNFWQGGEEENTRISRHPPVSEDDPLWPTCSICMNRHNGGVNYLFLDWSVRKVGLKELWTLKWHKRFNTAGKWTKAGGVQPEDWPVWMRRFKDY